MTPTYPLDTSFDHEQHLDPARFMRANLAKINPRYRLPEISYTVEEVVAGDCYGVFRNLHNVGVLLDIGANLGIVSIAARAMNPHVRIIAIEPHHYTAASLVTNTAPYNIEVCVHGMGNGSKFSMQHEDSPGFSPFTATACPTPEPAKEHCTYQSYGMTLHDIICNYHVTRTKGRKIGIKIDCEGGESALLEDQKSTNKLVTSLTICRGFCGMEIHTGEKYASYLSNGSPVTKDMWVTWVKDNIPRLWDPRFKNVSENVSILTFQNYAD